MHSNKVKHPQKEEQEEEEIESDSQDQGQNEYQENSFIANEQDEESDYDDRRKRASGEKKRRRRQSEVDDGLIEDDLDLIEQNEQKRRKLTKLKRNRPREVDDRKDIIGDEDQEIIEEDEQALYDQEDFEEQEESEVNDHFEKENNIEDIFQPGYDEFLLKNQDDMIINHDVPQRLLIKFRDRLEDKEIKEELKQEAQWIYQKIRDKLTTDRSDRRPDKAKETIFKVLELLRVEYCEIMYIYYYKRLVWYQQLTLDCLWRIYQLDDEWAIVRQMKKQLAEVRFPTLQSLNVDINPNIIKLLQETTDIKTLRYIKEYAEFQSSKHSSQRRKDTRRSHSAELIFQVTQHTSLLKWIQNDRVWLTPSQLYENIRDKSQRFKPKTPILNPKEQIQLFMNSRPFLGEHQIYTSIMTYLGSQLFNFPDLRRWMRQKYTKKTVISTTPTKKGQQDITLYSMYYPAKRIKKKPMTTFQGDLWILALEAQRAGLVRIDIMFEWQQVANTRVIQQDPVYREMIQLYFDHSEGSKITDIWNLFRKEVISKFICDYFVPQFQKQIKQQLYKNAEKQILATCAAKFRSELNKGPPTPKKDGKGLVVMGLVLQGQKLGLAIVDEDGNLVLKGSQKIPFNAKMQIVVMDKAITDPIDDFKPQLIIIAANCRQAIILRKQLRTAKSKMRPDREQFCDLGDYEICSKIAKYHTNKDDSNQERAILQAISLCRLKQNSMAQILSIWSEKIEDNGCILLNLHPLQKVLNRQKLKAELERVAVEMVNLVGIDLNKLKSNPHLQKQLQFVCGLGHKKSLYFLQKLKNFQDKDKEIKRRWQLHTQNIVGKVVYRNCSAFFKINTPLHQQMLRGTRHEKRDKEITLLELTRIHDENFSVVQEAAMVACSDPNKNKKLDYEQCIAQILRNPSKIRTVQFDNKESIDYEFICDEFSAPFKDPREREPKTQVKNKEAFYSILRESPETLKKYMVFSAKIINSNQNFLNVKIIDNGLFGSIRLPHENKQVYPKDSIIKAIITRFPFDPWEQRNRVQTFREGKEEQELLKVEMGLNFPHTSSRSHNCLKQCFEKIVQEIHPKIDINYFTIHKEDIPTLEVREQARNRTELRLINHPKFKNMGISQAIQWISSEPIGEFVIRPSVTKKECLTITWKFYQGVICHINVKAQARAMAALTYQYVIQERDGERKYTSFDDMIEKYIKPMNRIMDDVISNRKFVSLKPEKAEERLKQQRQKDPSIIHYYFGCSSQFPKFVVLYYMPRENKFVKELIRVKDIGLIFHDQTFANLKELTAWFKVNFADKDYQRYIPKSGITRTR